MKKQQTKKCPWCDGERKWLKLAKIWICNKCKKEIKDYKFIIK